MEVFNKVLEYQSHITAAAIVVALIMTFFVIVGPNSIVILSRFLPLFVSTTVFMVIVIVFRQSPLGFDDTTANHPAKIVSCEDPIWVIIREESLSDIKQEPVLSDYYHSTILSHKTLENSLATNLSVKLSNSLISKETLYKVFLKQLVEDPEIRAAIRDDLKAWKERDPACLSYVHCFLNFKGFLASQAQRIAHGLWKQGRSALALLIQNRVSEVFAVDIHPGARIGKGVVFDHATGVVIGETAVIGDDATIHHNVTLGGTGKDKGDRHPKIGDGVLIGAGTNVLGNIRIGDGSKVGAGSVVLKEVPSKATAVGNPAKLIHNK